jgi:hypothetical protein
MSRVHPRVIWIGVGLAVLGMVVAMLAMTYLDQRWWLWVGLAIVAGGVVLGWAFGLMRDVRMRPHGASVEASEVIHGETHGGVSPTSSIQASSPPPPAPATANAGADAGPRLPDVPTPERVHWTGLAMALLGGWMVIAPLLLFYPDTEVGNDVILRDYGFAAVLVVSGLLLRNPLRHAGFVVVPALAAALLLLAVAATEPVTVRATVNEVAAGLLTLGLCAAHIFLRAGIRRGSHAH